MKEKICKNCVFATREKGFLCSVLLIEMPEDGTCSLWSDEPEFGELPEIDEEIPEEVL